MISNLDSQLDPKISALLKSRQAMFAQAPSVLPHLHRRLRAAAMQPASLRETFLVRLSEWVGYFQGQLQGLLELTPTVGLRYAGAAAVLALTLFAGLKQTWKSDQGQSNGQALLTMNANQPAANVDGVKDQVNQVNYSLNDAGVVPVSLDQKIDQVTAGSSAFNNDAAKAHYVLTSAPATYDSVVSF